MCGLFGSTIHGEPSEKHFASLKTLSHRGPDQWGVWHDESVFMGHTRLSIIDLSDCGRQPMVRDEPKVVITVNGEIYNFQALRRELEVDCQFKSNSDSEVVLHGYVRWGIDGLMSRLEGMYAMAIYDLTARRLYLARDRAGIKPLFFAHLDGAFAWASELKALTSYFGNEKLQVDTSALYDFLSYLYIPTPKTAFKNVFQLPPAHIAAIDLNDFQSKQWRYWDLNLQVTPTTLPEASDRLAELLQNAVREQLVADVDIGYFLSGGLDSSAVVAFSDPESSNNRTFSIGFDHAEHDETKYASIVARHFGLKYRQEILANKSAADWENSFIDWFDEPFADTSAFPTFLVSRLAREEVTVVLTGDGGDEVFGGYERYEAFERLRSGSERNPAKLRIGEIIQKLPLRKASLLGRIRNRFLRENCLSDVELYCALLGGLIRSEKETYRKMFDIPRDYDDYWALRRFYHPDIPIYTRLQYLDFCTYLPDDILTKVDRTSMALSLETRVPLLSTDLVEFSFSLPESIRLANGELKGLLKLALKNRLPSEILTRKKKGFSVPERHWHGGMFDKRFTKQENILRMFSDRFGWADL